MILTSAVSSQYTRGVTERQTKTDGRHLMTIAELAMQLQCSAKDRPRGARVIVKNKVATFSGHGVVRR